MTDLDSQLASFSQKGITRFSLHEGVFSRDRNYLKNFLSKAKKYIPEVFISIPVEAEVIDCEIVALCKDLFCSLDIFFRADEIAKKIGEKNSPKGAAFFDKKLFSKKAALLNDADLVFGFLADFAISPRDSIKFFRERLDFAMTLYPNHLEFPQIYSDEREEKCTATFSSQDISYAQRLAFAAEIFYSYGRAVPWFNSVLKPLKISPSNFFSDFAEWQICNNCGFKSREKVAALSHKEIEKMQLLFLEEKYDEKNLRHVFPAVRDVVLLNGAFSRLAGEGEECSLELSFNPDDLLSPAAMDLPAFCENICMEKCRVKIFAGDEGPDYKIF
ncbi:MAG: hypothetical protein K2N58_08435 [Treponemataceae bacterium]|nr:hypothetical protein [Treponemataceae bacterium]